jgi:hypothetical protein
MFLCESWDPRHYEGTVHQSKPSIEGSHVNTRSGRCKPNPPPVR